MTRALPAWIVAALGAAAYVALDPPSADLAAQEYRVGLFERDGFALWNNGWYAGHHLPAYSVLFGPLGALLGAQVAGALSAVAAAALFAALAHRHWGERARLGSLWFAVGIAATLLTGRLTFVLGVALGLGAVLALQRERRALAAALAALSTLASPVAGLFVALAAVAWGLATRERAWGGGIAAAALAPAAALALLFPEGGTEPFVPSAFWPALAALILAGAVLPRRERALRIGVALYAVGTVAAFLLATPVGGNVTRLGALLAGPVVACVVLAGRGRALPTTRPAVVAVLLPALAYWQLYPPVRDVARAAHDPSVHAAYHAPLVRFLEGQGEGFRVEIPFTENHWEAAHVAPHVPIARGWERQLDRKQAALFYGDGLDPRAYRRWLDDHAVRYVALPDVDLDPAARDEAALIRAGLPWLREVWRDEHWRVFAVAGASPLASGDAPVALRQDGFTVDARRPGAIDVRVRHSRWWAVTSGDACVEEAADGFTRVNVRSPGRVRVAARMTGGPCGR